MENSIGKRIEQLMRREGLNNNVFGQKIGVSQPAISKITSGESKPSFGVLEKIMESFPNLNPMWLLKGKGEMFLDENGNVVVDDRSVLATITNKYEQIYQDLRETIKSRDAMLNDLRCTIEDLRYTINLQKGLLGKLNPTPNDQDTKNQLI